MRAVHVTYSLQYGIALLPQQAGSHFVAAPTLDKDTANQPWAIALGRRLALIMYVLLSLVG